MNLTSGIALILCILALARKSSYRYQSFRQPTEKQLQYIQHLIQNNNKYRATPWTLDDWINIYFRGQWDVFLASQLISKLKKENQNKLAEFTTKVQKSNSVPRDHFFASDYGVHEFCPNALFWSVRGYVNKNLYELESGSLYHGDSDHIKSVPKSNTNTQFLMKNDPNINQVCWFQLEKSEPFYSKEMNFSGIPDGMIYFENKSCSVVELKTKNSIENLQEAYLGDILQACAYHYLIKDSREIKYQSLSDVGYILYVDKRTQDRALFEFSFKENLQRFRIASEAMKFNSANRQMKLFSNSSKKCGSCGYRHLCLKNSKWQINDTYRSQS